MGDENLSPFRASQLDELMPPSQNFLSDMEQGLREEINQLHQNTIFIHKSFLRLEKEFAEVDRKELIDANGTRIPELRPKWTKYHNRYRDIIRCSQETATQAAAHVNVFMKVHLSGIETLVQQMKDPNISFDQKQDSMRSACEGLKRFREKHNQNPALRNAPAPGNLNTAQQHANDFEVLIADLDVFQAVDLSTFSEDNQELTSKVGNLRREIESLNYEISSCEVQLNDLGVPLSAIETSDSPRILSLLKLIAPKTAQRMQVAVLGARSGNQDAVNQIYKKHSKCMAEKGSLTAQLTEISTMRTQVKEQKETISKICKHLKGFEKIWTWVAFHAMSAEEYLKDGIGAGHYSFFIPNFELIRGTYGGLYEGLKTYATLVSDSGVAQEFH